MSTALHPVPPASTTTRVEALQAQLEEATLAQIDEAIAASRDAAAQWLAVSQGAAPEGLRARAGLLARHMTFEADSLKVLRDRLRRR